TLLPDPVVPPGDIEIPVIKKLGQDVDPDPGVGVALGVAVPVGVENGPGLVELGAVAGAQRRQGVDPFAVALFEAGDGDRAVTVGVAPAGGEQLERADRRVGVAVPDPLLLGDDRLGGGGADREPAAEPVGLAVVIDQHGGPVGV